LKVIRETAANGGKMAVANFELLDKAETEAARVFAWRFHELSEAGYELDDALMLATATDVDLHLATDLLRRGCPVSAALRILL
jgi:hypothetical protein